MDGVEEEGCLSLEEQLHQEHKNSSRWSFGRLNTIASLAAVAGLLLTFSNLHSKSAETESFLPRRLGAVYEGLDEWLFDGHHQVGSTHHSAGMKNAPSEDMHDGNLCGNDEELFDDLCYAKCSLLTGGSHPVRTSSFSCCKSHPCEVWNTKVNFPPKPCKGFDVAGDVAGATEGCPHAIGTCLSDEELLLNTCYKKCELLTDGQFPHRISADTCCRTTGLGCLHPSNLNTDFKRFPVGGGADDGDEATPSKPHPPLTSLTEKK
eukprot:TRINITY_DN66592_c0_g1_i1.p1 TRINITY_DN66592_c0_g1~~TRINITY_DN66592_c0_g1_i1.p1  ORF type:complete len:263 (-),score=50.06 TRINITY_DN66592_c0_g1_i1:283-1071(-)